MDIAEYAVITNGVVIDGFEREQVVAALASLFKCPPDKAESLVSGRRLPLKRGLNRQKAEQYNKALRAVGLDAAVVAPKPPPATQDKPAVNSGGGLSLALEAVPATAQAEPAATPQAAAAPAPAEAQEEDDAEETSILQDLADFVGPTYEARFRQRFAELAQNDGGYAVHWNWPAFLIPIPWFLYRKLYVAAAVIFVANLLMAPHYLPQLLLMIAAGMGGTYLYYRKAMKVVAAETTQGEVRRQALASRGGTHSVLVVIALCVVLGFASFTVMRHRLGAPSFAQMQAQQAHDQATIANASDKPTAKQLMVLRAIIDLGLVAHGIHAGADNMPQDDDDLSKRLKLKQDLLNDRWGHQIIFAPQQQGFSLRSAGPDGDMNTDDDVVVEQQLQR